MILFNYSIDYELKSEKEIPVFIYWNIELKHVTMVTD